MAPDKGLSKFHPNILKKYILKLKKRYYENRRQRVDKGMRKMDVDLPHFRDHNVY